MTIAPTRMGRTRFYATTPPPGILVGLAQWGPLGVLHLRNPDGSRVVTVLAPNMKARLDRLWRTPPPGSFWDRAPLDDLSCLRWLASTVLPLTPASGQALMTVDALLESFDVALVQTVEEWCQRLNVTRDEEPREC